MADQFDELAGLLAALPALDGAAKTMAIDDILTRLSLTAPEVAKIVGSVVGALSPSSQVGIRESYGLYAGGPLVPAIQDSGPRVDCLVLTIKPDEYSGALQAFGIQPGTPQTVLSPRLGVHVTSHHGTTFAIGLVGTDGNAESAIRLGGLYSALRPRSAVLIGMAGGVRDKVKLGDVVVADAIHAYQFVKMTKDGPVQRTKTKDVDEPLIRLAELVSINHPDWAEEVSVGARNLRGLHAFPGNEVELLDENWRPSVKRGGILAGGLLIEDGTLPKLAKSIQEQTKAAEMEGGGFAAACIEANIPWLVIRGIADYGEPQRRTHWQLPATYAAARFLRDGLDFGLLDLRLTAADAGRN